VKRSDGVSWQKMHGNEQKEVVNINEYICGHRGLRWDMAQDGKLGNVRCAQKVARVITSVMWNCGLSRARKGAGLALSEVRNALVLLLWLQGQALS
jgi:hypothetical protein